MATKNKDILDLQGLQTYDGKIKGLISDKADNTTSFTEALTRENIASGETIPTILGKIKKWFTDLKTVAFTGSYNDLSDKPTDTNNRRAFFGTCDTASGTPTKVVTLSDTNGWELTAGTIVGVNFDNYNTAESVKLNINDTGAKNIWYDGGIYVGSTMYICGYANRTIYYMYDGTYWRWLSMGAQWPDGRVGQTATDSTNADYEVIFSYTANNVTTSEEARKSSKLKFNPSTGNLQTTQINGVTVGNSPKFTDTTYTPATAAPGAIASSGSVGTSTNYARQDHTHAITVATGDSNGQVKIAGQNASVKGLGTAAYTASTDYAVNKLLTNEDLNTITDPGFYNAGGGNTVTNKPSGMDAFGMEVIHNAAGNYYVQVIYGSNSAIAYRRKCNNGTWADWTGDKYTDTNNRKSFYGTCDTASATAAKVVTLSDTTGWELKAGTIVGVKFTNTNTATNCTININGTGAKNVYYGTGVNSDTNYAFGSANRISYFMYDGTYWVWMSYSGIVNDSTWQENTTANSDFRVMLSGNPNDTSQISGVKKSSKLTFNPSTSELKLNSKYVPASSTIKEIQLVSSLPSDASSHPEILYLVGGS